MLEKANTFLSNFSILLVALNFILTFIEISTICTIHPPKRQTFADIRVKEEQFQTIIAPAMAALVSGLLVSISASFFYSNLVNESKDWYRYVGLGVFFAAALSLIFTINLALKGGAQAAELARNPFTIRAAAEEFTDDPRYGPVDPGTLSENLKDWTRNRSAHAFNLDRDIDCSDFDKKLDSSAKMSKWPGLKSSLKIYYLSVRRMPFRFGWPLIGPALLLVSVFVKILIDQDLDSSGVSQWWRPLLNALLFGMISVLFYGTARGNRARLWHRVYQIGRVRAEAAVAEAEKEQDAIRTEDERLKRVLREADKFFGDSCNIEKEKDMFDLTIGRVCIRIRRR